MHRSGDIILDARNLNVSFGGVEAVRWLSMSIERGSIAGIVGESGSGKSTILRCIAGLLKKNAAFSGDIVYEGASLFRARKNHLDPSTRRISYVFQDPLSSLDPLYTIRSQFDECLSITGTLAKEEFELVEKNLLEDMGIKDIDRVLDSYPHQLSGGMCQRVVLAMCLGQKPDLLLADEPTSSLDVVSQAQVLEKLKHIRDVHGTTILIVSHDIAAIAETADHIGVMYKGVLVEEGTAEEITRFPAHPYTRDLINSVPRLDGSLPKVPKAWVNSGDGASLLEKMETTSKAELDYALLSETHRVLQCEEPKDGSLCC